MEAIDISGLSRVCKKCNSEKSLEDFQRHPTCSMGRLHSCKACTTEASVKRNQTPEAKLRRSLAFKEKWASDPEFRERAKESGRKWFGRDDVKEKMRIRQAERRAANPQEFNRRRKLIRTTKAKDPKEILNSRIRSNLNYSMKSRGLGKGGARSFQILGYSSYELARHLEMQFLPGMGWDNMSEWHVDHIIPLSSFNFSSIDDHEFKRAWALTNLRPLWARENLKKHASMVFLI